MQFKYQHKEGDCAVKVKNISEFYRDLIYYSNSQSALMVKMVNLKKNKKYSPLNLPNISSIIKKINNILLKITLN